MPKAPKRKYSQGFLESALEAIRSGTSIREAAKKFGVPRATLHEKAKNQSPMNATLGAPTVLTAEEEKHVVNWILHLANTGFPINKEQLLDSVKLLVDKMGRTTPFTNNRPGRHWYEAFLRRHSELSTRVAQNLTYTRASATEEKLRNWFDEINAYLESKNLLNIDSSRSYNCDETAFLLCPKADSVLVRKGSKAVYKIVDGDEKECLTTLFMVNAAGTMLPPLVMFWYKRIPSSISSNFPPEWSIGTSEKGWMTAESFFEYITNVFHPWLKKNKIQFPVILYVDGHSSHCTYPLSEFCRSEQIELIALYPNATHILQPLDVAVFHPMKTAWKKTVTSWRMENNGLRLRKEMFAPVLKKAIESLSLTEAIKNGFRTCGLYPFSAESVDFNILQKGAKESKKSDPIDSPQVSATTAQFNSSDGLVFIEKHLSRDILESFKESEEVGRWAGDATQRGLFEFWLRINKLAETEKSKANGEQLTAQSEQQIEGVTLFEEEVPDDSRNVNFSMGLDEQNTVDMFADIIEFDMDLDDRSFSIDGTLSFIDENNNTGMGFDDGSVASNSTEVFSSKPPILIHISNYQESGESGDYHQTLDNIDGKPIDFTSGVEKIADGDVNAVIECEVDVAPEKRIEIAAKEKNIKNGVIVVMAAEKITSVADHSTDGAIGRIISGAVETSSDDVSAERSIDGIVDVVKNCVEATTELTKRVETVLEKDAEIVSKPVEIVAGVTFERVETQPKTIETVDAGNAHITDEFSYRLVETESEVVKKCSAPATEEDNDHGNVKSIRDVPEITKKPVEVKSAIGDESIAKNVHMLTAENSDHGTEKSICDPPEIAEKSIEVEIETDESNRSFIEKNVDIVPVDNSDHGTEKSICDPPEIAEKPIEVEIETDESNRSFIEKNVDIVPVDNSDHGTEKSICDPPEIAEKFNKTVSEIVEKNFDTVAVENGAIDTENGVNVEDDTEKNIENFFDDGVSVVAEASFNLADESAVNVVTRKSSEKKDDRFLNSSRRTTGTVIGDEAKDRTTNIVSNRVPDGVPTVFKEALFWPPDIEKTKKKNTTKLKTKAKKVPSVATSDAWMDYHNSRKQEQERLQLEKEQRQKHREEMQAEKKRLQEEKRILRDEKKKEQAEKKRLQDEEKQQKQAERKKILEEKKKLQEQMKELQVQLTKPKKPEVEEKYR